MTTRNLSIVELEVTERGRVKPRELLSNPSQPGSRGDYNGSKWLESARGSHRHSIFGLHLGKINDPGARAAHDIGPGISEKTFRGLDEQPALKSDLIGNTPSLSAWT